MVIPLKFKTTKDIKVPKRIIDQVLGQTHAADIIRKVAKQKRHLLLIGEPGTGKSMLGQALSELLTKEKLVDILTFPNPNDENIPLIRTISMGQGRNLVTRAKMQANSAFKGQNIVFFILILLAMIAPWWVFSYYTKQYGSTVGAILSSASLLSSMVFLGLFILFINLNRRIKTNVLVPKLIVDNYSMKRAPFVDATGAHAGALLGDVLHDPLQSGGLGTPSYERVIPGMIHRANGGVLFIDEIATLHSRTQQELLTALQEKKYAITGQSERSSGSSVRTEPVPTDFILVAAGNLETVKNMHPALRSRIRGFGYEVYMNDVMEDTIENRNNLALFVAQEVVKDGKIPHFSKEAVDLMIQEARRMGERAGKLTVRLRELGGLIRASGDLALEKGDKIVLQKHILEAKKFARPLEKQLVDKYIESRKAYEVITVKGSRVGRVNGLAVMGTPGAFSGIVLPIESEVTPGGKKTEIIATGNLGDIAKEAIKNVSAIIMKYFGEDIKEKYDLYVQFLQTQEGVEGDSASVAVATSIISALKKIPVRQDTAMTGSLSVRGEVLAIGGISAKVEAAVDSGITRIIIPASNKNDITLQEDKLKKIKIIPAKTITDVLKEALDWKGKTNILKKMVSTP